MKLVFSLLSLLLINKECNSSKTPVLENENTPTTQTQNLEAEKLQDQNMIISYSAFTRGTNKKITVSKSEIIVENSSAKTPKIKLPCSAEDWEHISTLISKIDTKNLMNLKPPSTKSYSDAGLAANLKISIADKMYATQDFDHGNPPKEIAPLVNKLLSFIEKEQ